MYYFGAWDKEQVKWAKFKGKDTHNLYKGNVIAGDTARAAIPYFFKKAIETRFRDAIAEYEKEHRVWPCFLSPVFMKNEGWTGAVFMDDSADPSEDSLSFFLIDRECEKSEFLKELRGEYMCHLKRIFNHMGISSIHPADCPPTDI